MASVITPHVGNLRSSFNPYDYLSQWCREARTLSDAQVLQYARDTTLISMQRMVLRHELRERGLVYVK